MKEWVMEKQKEISQVKAMSLSDVRKELASKAFITSMMMLFVLLFWA
jgi:hypothetical protein